MKISQADLVEKYLGTTLKYCPYCGKEVSWRLAKKFGAVRRKICFKCNSCGGGILLEPVSRLFATTTYQLSAKKSNVEESIEMNMPTEIFFIPPGQVADRREHFKTKVMGTRHYVRLNQDISIGDYVEVAHERVTEYPENTNIYVGNEKVGCLQKDIAKKWLEEYGEGFRLTGEVKEWKGDNNFPVLVVDIFKPLFRNEGSIRRYRI